MGIIGNRPILCTLFHTVSVVYLTNCTKLHTLKYTSTLSLPLITFNVNVVSEFRIKRFIIRLMIIIDQVILLCCSYVMIN